MRCGLIIYGRLDIMTGGFLYDRKVTEYLRGRGEEVEIIALPWRDYARSFLDNFSSSLPKRLGAANVTILLQDELAHPSLVRLNRTLKRRNRRPIISIVHHLRSSEQRPSWLNLIYRVIERAYLNSCDGFIFNSLATKKAVERIIGAPKPFVVAYPAGNRFNHRLGGNDIKERCFRDGPLELLFIGSVIARKNLHVLLRALKEVDPALFRLTVVGDCDLDRQYARSLYRLIDLYGLNDRIEFAGPIPDSALEARLARSQVLTAPSSYEGFGIVYLEGMSFGLPAIAGARGGAAEIVDHGQNGFLTPPDDHEALAAHIEALARDRETLYKMSLNAYKKYLEYPTWEQSARKVHHFLRGLEPRP